MAVEDLISEAKVRVATSRLGTLMARETDKDLVVMKKLVEELQIQHEREKAIRMLHDKEMFGDCVEDGEVYPCKTIQVLDWRPSE